ncbi:MAG: hypothetical protein ACXVDD_03025, partial [Polyangia bacterium]
MSFALAAAAVVAAGCGSHAPSRCPLTVWYRPAALDAEHAPLPPSLVGSWDGWTSSLRAFATVTADDGTLWRSATIQLAPGTYRYSIVVGDARIKDELNPRSAFIAGPNDPFELEVSEVELADCSAPVLTATAARGDGSALVVDAELAPGADRAPLDKVEATVEQAGVPVTATITIAAADSTHVSARADGLAPGKYTMRLAARDTHGRALLTAASAFVGTPIAPASLADTLVYQVMIDRFRGAKGPLAAPASPGDRAGGTLDGVRAALDAGYFERLGVTTLWLSP